jgi:periplasmic divalent cation tolerance protein
VDVEEEMFVADYLQVLTTAGSSGQAEQLGRGVVEARLAACVQIIGPIRSLYWWDDKVSDDQEWQLLMKTTTEQLPELERYIKANHSYDTPEIIATPILWGSQEYLGWISAETQQTDASS